jgi:hypothetical protein
MKPSIRACYKLCPFHYIGIFLSLNIFIWLVVAALTLTPWFALGGIYIFYALLKLSTDLEIKCIPINEAGMTPTGLFYKDGKPQMRGMNYAMEGVMILVPLAMITGFLSCFSWIIIITLVA